MRGFTDFDQMYRCHAQSNRGLAVQKVSSGMWYSVIIIIVYDAITTY